MGQFDRRSAACFHRPIEALSRRKKRAAVGRETPVRESVRAIHGGALAFWPLPVRTTWEKCPGAHGANATVCAIAQCQALAVIGD